MLTAVHEAYGVRRRARQESDLVSALCGGVTGLCVGFATGLAFVGTCFVGVLCGACLGTATAAQSARTMLDAGMSADKVSPEHERTQL